MKIKFEGNEYDAYALIMRKPNAQAILSGKKTLEIRQFSNRYVKMFTDFEQVEKNAKLREEGRDDECQSSCRGDIGVVHFYSTGAPWFLDVKIDEIGIATMCEEDIKFLNDEYDFHDYDNEWQQFNDLPFNEKPMFYYLHISDILQYEGLD